MNEILPIFIIYVRTQHIPPLILSCPHPHTPLTPTHFTPTDGMTALILAAQDGKFPVVKYLIDQGAHIDARSLIGWTALMAAVAHTETARYLVDRGAKLNFQDEDGWTAMHLAARQGSFGTVALLCEAGALTLTKDKNGMAAVDVAKTEAIREYLVSYHKEKDSGLMGACRSGNVEQVSGCAGGGLVVSGCVGSGLMVVVGGEVVR